MATLHTRRDQTQTLRRISRSAGWFAAPPAVRRHARFGSGAARAATTRGRRNSGKAIHTLLGQREHLVVRLAQTEGDSYGYRVAKRRDGRRFGPGPYVLGFKRLNWGDEFPFSVPAIANIEQLGLSASVTLLAGENGSGKSTILEAIAAAIGFAEHGGELDRLGELPAVPRNVLDEHDVPLLAPVLSRTRPRNGYFLRAESFL